MIKIYVHGATGKMGQEIVELIGTSDDLSYLGPIDRSYSVVPESNSVVIDFSLPVAMDRFVSWCRAHSIKVVSGTTGLTADQMQNLKSLGSDHSVLWASNMSVGMAVIQKMLAAFAGIRDWDFQLEEFHHIKKKDSPSGTARTLQSLMESTVGKELPPVMAGRGGGIFGIHKIWAMAADEIIRIEHEALNRKVFAQGSLTAARWISEQGNGFYDFSQILDDM